MDNNKESKHGNKPAPPEGTLRAAALKYDANEDSAPQIVGLGVGYVAKNMVEAAKEGGVPVVEDEDASRELLKLGLGQDIPPELYEVIAEILVFVAQLDGNEKRRFGMDEKTWQSL